MKKIICFLLAVCVLTSGASLAFAAGAAEDVGSRTAETEESADTIQEAGAVEANGSGANAATGAAETYTIGELEIPYDENGAAALDALGLFKGTGAGYALDENLTRAQAIVMVLRMIGEEDEVRAAIGDRHFIDTYGHWAGDAIEYAYGRGYINGTSENEFTPERSVTGREFVKMLLGAMGYDNLTLENAYEKAVETDLLLNNYTRTAVATDGYELKRSDAVRICRGALLSELPDGRMLKELLIERGVFTDAEFGDVMGSATPAVSATPLSREDRDFAWNLNSEAPTDQNYMFSPFSIKAALAMAANGAEGETRREILDALGVEDLDAFNDRIRYLIDSYSNNYYLTLSVANSIWLNRDYPYAEDAEFSDTFRAIIEKMYSGEVGVVNNSNAVDTVNNWVEENTSGRITDIINSPDFLAALVNAVYFKGEWLNHFKPEYNDFKTFTSRDGSEAELEFMNRTGYYGYYENNSMRMIAIPYKDMDTDIAMYIAIGAGRAVDLDRYIPEMESAYVNLSIPKFKTEYSVELNDTLKAIGIEKAFSEFDAEFSGMVDNYPMNMFIDEVVHKTYISIDEIGTEAAAATAIMAGGSGASQPPEPIDFIADEPFTYFIYDSENDEILFVGEYSEATT